APRTGRSRVRRRRRLQPSASRRGRPGSRRSSRRCSCSWSSASSRGCTRSGARSRRTRRSGRGTSPRRPLPAMQMAPRTISAMLRRAGDRLQWASNTTATSTWTEEKRASKTRLNLEKTRSREATEGRKRRNPSNLRLRLPPDRRPGHRPCSQRIWEGRRGRRRGHRRPTPRPSRLRRPSPTRPRRAPRVRLPRARRPPRPSRASSASATWTSETDSDGAAGGTCPRTWGSGARPTTSRGGWQRTARRPGTRAASAEGVPSDSPRRPLRQDVSPDEGYGREGEPKPPLQTFAIGKCADAFTIYDTFLWTRLNTKPPCFTGVAKSLQWRKANYLRTIVHLL
ncbi:hypothetical protein ACHAWF_015952, partial [Thalassiosira exigua]